MLGEIILYFLKLGLLGFGGPLALISSMQRDLVEKRGWISEAEFQKSFALIKAMPGPIAFQVATYLGRKRGGFWGAFLAGFGLVFPSFVMMIVAAASFSRFQGNPDVDLFLRGMQVAALGVILASLKGLARGQNKDALFFGFALLSLLASWRFPAAEPLIILGSGILYLSIRTFRPGLQAFAWPLLIVVFAKAGALVFGSGLAIVPMLEADVVTKYGWLTHEEFMTAIAFGQITPGPVTITATYIGYKVFGFAGAVIATVSVFGPAFFHMTTWFPPFLDRLSRLKGLPLFVNGAIAAVLGSILGVVIKLGVQLHLQTAEIACVLVVLALGLFTKFPAWAMIPLAGLIFWITHGL